MVDFPRAWEDDDLGEDDEVMMMVGNVEAGEVKVESCEGGEWSERWR